MRQERMNIWSCRQWKETGCAHFLQQPQNETNSDTGLLIILIKKKINNTFNQQEMESVPILCGASVRSPLSGSRIDLKVINYLTSYLNLF